MEGVKKNMETRKYGSKKIIINSSLTPLIIFNLISPVVFKQIAKNGNEMGQHGQQVYTTLSTLMSYMTYHGTGLRSSLRQNRESSDN